MTQPAKITPQPLRTVTHTIVMWVSPLGGVLLASLPAGLPGSTTPLPSRLRRRAAARGQGCLWGGSSSLARRAARPSSSAKPPAGGCGGGQGTCKKTSLGKYRDGKLYSSTLGVKLCCHGVWQP